MRDLQALAVLVACERVGFDYMIVWSCTTCIILILLLILYIG